MGLRAGDSYTKRVRVTLSLAQSFFAGRQLVRITKGMKVLFHARLIIDCIQLRLVPMAATAVPGTVSHLQPRKLLDQLPSAEKAVQSLNEVVREANTPTSTPPRVDTQEQKLPTKIKVNGVDAVMDIKQLPGKPPLSSPDCKGPTSTATEHFAFAEGFNTSPSKDQYPTEGVQLVYDTELELKGREG
jgi:hypothetical protein